MGERFRGVNAVRSPGAVHDGVQRGPQGLKVRPLVPPAASKKQIA